MEWSESMDNNVIMVQKFHGVHACVAETGCVITCMFQEKWFLKLFTRFTAKFKEQFSRK